MPPHTAKSHGWGTPDPRGGGRGKHRCAHKFDAADQVQLAEPGEAGARARGRHWTRHVEGHTSYYYTPPMYVQAARTGAFTGEGVNTTPVALCKYRSSALHSFCGVAWPIPAAVPTSDASAVSPETDSCTRAPEAESTEIWPRSGEIPRSAEIS